MLFHSVTQRDLPLLRSYYRTCPYALCEYSAGIKLMWRGFFHGAIAEEAGCLIVRNCVDGQYRFEYPVPGRDGDEDAALTAIENYCMHQEIPLRFSAVPEDKAQVLLRRYPRIRISRPRVWSDYLYTAASLAVFAGRHYAGQRNHINRFRKLYPNAVFRSLGKDDRAEIDAFWRDYEAEFDKPESGAKRELRLAKRMLRLAGSPHFAVGGMELDGKLLSLSLGERCGTTMIVHIEKALYHCDGIYPATVQAFARTFGEGIAYFNREDDAGDRGLRISKLQYLPARMAEEYTFDVETELTALAAIPQLKTERLTLSALTDADRDAYTALCADDARNRWWGYDYHKDHHGEPLSEYFLQTARDDFAKRTSMSFAVRLNGRCIGEVVLYRFNGRGEAEIGCRILPQFAHCGYGTEAFAAAADWALYALSLRRAVAKCYRENRASERMLASCMRRCGEDETYFYFEKTV